MSTYDLRAFQDNAGAEIQSLRGRIQLNGKWSAFRKVSREVSDSFMTLAVASLLSDMKPDMFFKNLCRSAENWRRYLVSSDKHFNKASPLIYNSPLYAAIVSGDEKILSGIETALPLQWQQGEEYEDQFHICWLHLLLSLNGCTLDEKVEQHLSILEDVQVDTEKSDLFKALLGIDDLKEEDFWNYFDIALLAYEEHVNAKVATFTTKVTQFIPHRYVWFEGLTWLRLAIDNGFTLPSKMIAFCPDEALAVIKNTYKGDWLLIPLPDNE